MRTKLVQIGNSRGVRIPKAAIEHYGLSDQIELDMEPGGLIVRPVRTARRGWDAAFARMRKSGDDELLDVTLTVSNQWDRKEWTW